MISLKVKNRMNWTISSHIIYPLVFQKGRNMKSRDSENLKRAKTNFDNPKIWKDSEIAFIRKNIDTMTNKELADHLNTSLDTVKMKIRKERIIRKNFKRPVNEIKNEKWITIKSATRYSVSNFGRVKHDLENFLVSVNVLETGY
jgi:hypothetical protein